jgi:AcrR family transcriptional regulator
MKGRAQCRKEERRQSIVEVARRAFFRSGYGGTSMSSIAAELGGSKATLWAYFRSKEELFAAVIDDLVDRYGEALNQPIPLDGDPEAALKRLARDFMQTLFQPDIIALQRLVTGEAGRFPELGRLFHERGPQRALDHLGTWFEALMVQGFLRRGDPVLAARHFIALCQSGGFQLAMWGIEPVPSEETVQTDMTEAVQTFLRAFGFRAIGLKAIGARSA